MTNTPYTPSTITFKPLCTLLYLSLNHLPPTLFHPTFPCLDIPSWNPLQPRTQPLPLTMPLQFPGPQYPTRNSPCTPPLLLLQDNIMIHVQILSTFQTPAVKESYLSYHPRSIIKCINTTSSMEIHQNYPLLTHHFYPSPPLPPSTTSTPVTKQKTYGCNNTPPIHEHPS